MTVVETILVFVGAPLAIIAVLALLIFVPGSRRHRVRYKPGQAWEHDPIWYEPHPEGPAGGHGGGFGAAVTGSETKAIGSSVYGEPTGDYAHADGAATAPRPRSGGPLGGARGTW